jgi:GGDEF domain-containing protein
VIQRVGHALSARLRTSDVSARLGGDEFGVILRRVRAEEADRVALELLDHVQGAIGSDADGPGLEPDELLRAADAAMYQAKSRGGGAIARAN